jgi:hypothetical protein
MCSPVAAAAGFEATHVVVGYARRFMERLG